MILDLFSGGGGGWCLAARSLGLPSVGLEWDGPACGTRSVVGLPTIRADVSTYPAEVFAGKVEGLCGGPPCQSFSAAGKGKGLDDPRGQMVYEPMRYVRACRPRWVALEQVPEVLGYWRWIARELVTMGYGVWTGILNAADYGVPQIRKRAILLASVDRQVQPPAPTHSKHGGGDLFGGSLPRWISMAEGLGWTKGGPCSGVDGCRGSCTSHDGVLRTGTKTQLSSVARTATDGSCSRPDAPTPPSPGWPTRPSSQPRVRGPLPLHCPASTDRSTIALGHNASAWCWERPAVVVTASRHGGLISPCKDDGVIPVEPWELGVLQGFPADHPWQAPRVSAQIGNAIPPPLALACLSAVSAVCEKAA